MKKLFTLAAAVLASVSMWAATETVPKFSDNWTGISINFSNNEGANGSSDQKKDGDTEKVTYVKFRTNKNGNTITLNVNEGYQVTGLSVRGYTNDGSTGVSLVSVKYDNQDAVETNIDFPLSGAGTTATYQNNTDVARSAIVLQMSNSGKQLMAVMTVTYSLACTSPENPLSLSSDAAETVYVGDVITFSTAGGNGGAVKFYEGESEIANPWTATAGAHTIVAKQEANGDYCETVSNDLALNVLEKTPVTACVIDGPTNGFIGDELVYTATAANATVFEWYLDGAKQGSDSAKYIFTAAKGTHQIFAIAYNEFNTDENKAWSEAINVSVTKLCGELIKATHTGGKTATVTGVVGGTVDKNTQDGGKLGSNGHYFGIKLASGNFQTGDTVTIEVSKLEGGNAVLLFTDKGETALNTEPLPVDTLAPAQYTLPTSCEWIYIYRKSSATNPSVKSISVTRPCEESDNNNASVTINGEAAEKKGTVFNYTLGNSYTDPTVDVVITLEHPLATLMEDHAASFTMPTPEVGTPSVETFKVKAENGDQAWYSIFVNKAAGLSNNADLSALSVAGLTLSPDFAADVTEYTVTKAYSAAMPAVGDVTATPADANAKGAEVTIAGNVITVTVTAEDNTTKDYTITVNSADAKKDLLEASFSNGVNGFIAAGNINVPYLAGETEPTFVAAKFWNAEGEPTAEMVEGKLVVTGADSKKAQYTITFVPVTPMEYSTEEVVFDTVPSYIYSVYGFNSAQGRGVVFSKDVEEASNHRISEGKDRIYIALPAAKSVNLTSGTAANRKVIVTVNGVVGSVTKTAAANAAISIALNSTKPNLVGIESNGESGDGGFIKLQLQQNYPTSLDNTEDNTKAIKAIENGQIVIIKNGVRYNVLGAVLK